MEELRELYREATGLGVCSVDVLPAAGSNRRYYRMKGADGATLIGVIGTGREENQAFCYLARHFCAAGLPVPHVIAESRDGLRYLQTDLGSLSLYDALKGGREAGGRYNARERELLRRTIAALPALQIRGAEGLDFSRCYPQEAFDEQGILFDLNYFKYCFLRTSGLDFHEVRLEETFRQMAHDIAGLSSGAFMYRDFQARNVMLDAEGNPFFIDFQGGRRGPVGYDVASFLWQASARYPRELREELIGVYLDAAAHLQASSESPLKVERSLPSRGGWEGSGFGLCVLLRLLQVLGAYGFRGYFERKKYFLDSIPSSVENLRELLSEGLCPYPYLHELLTALVSRTTTPRVSLSLSSPLPAFPGGEESGGKGSPLVVRVLSFSYRNGIPEDTSGNGGGYVFDCRATHNPGRYEPYRHLTGLDEPVVRFLEGDGEILTFLESVRSLADAHVARYLERGFTSLMFCFGCTGGQHRSVYLAQHLARHIHEKFGIEVRICHREQGISETLGPDRAMVLAAGLGTRLGTITGSMPKALVPVCGEPLLQHLLRRLKASGFRDVVINVHHFADMIEEWCRQHPQGMRIRFSDERGQLLETGGGIKHALPLLCDAADGFLVHNVDILSNADLRGLRKAAKGRAATLLVSERETKRYLLFDDDMRLVGWTNTSTGEVRSPYPNLSLASCRKYAFSGIHYVTPRLFRHFGEAGERFGIVDFYLNICAEEPIYGYLQSGLRLVDAGKADALPAAEEFLRNA